MKQIDIITGASSGIGAEFARQYFLKTKSDEMWLIARREKNLQKLTDELNSIAHTKNIKSSCTLPLVRFFAIDISGKEGVERFKKILEYEEKKQTLYETTLTQKNFSETHSKKSLQNFSISISLLLNNAGFGTYGPFAETNIDREMQMIDLNCTSLTALCSICIPYMKKGSAILNTASLAAFLPLGNFAVYAATKSYVLSFSYALAAELKERSIHVCALCPGSVSTEFAKVASNGYREKVLHGKPTKKVVSSAIKSLEKKHYAALAYLSWKITAFMSRFVGRYLCAWYTYKFNKRPYKEKS